MVTVLCKEYYEVKNSESLIYHSKMDLTTCLEFKQSDMCGSSIFLLQLQEKCKITQVSNLDSFHHCIS